MRPFFSYYGAKWTMAKHYGPPRGAPVIEPFAGSACYSTRWAVEEAILVDLSPDVATLWTYLIAASSSDILALPDALESNEELAALPDGPRHLLGFWVSKGRAEVSRTLSPWYFQYRGANDCRVWGAAAKQRIAAQVDRIKGWQIICGDYRSAPEIAGAHYHVDPPYDNRAGQRYPHADLDYATLAKWCRARPGPVDVCENVGAEWLPFKQVHTINTTRGKRSGAVSAEAVWRPGA